MYLLAFAPSLSSRAFFLSTDLGQCVTQTEIKILHPSRGWEGLDMCGDADRDRGGHCSSKLSALAETAAGCSVLTQRMVLPDHRGQRPASFHRYHPLCSATHDDVIRD